MAALPGETGQNALLSGALRGILQFVEFARENTVRLERHALSGLADHILRIFLAAGSTQVSDQRAHDLVKEVSPTLTGQLARQ